MHYDFRRTFAFAAAVALVAALLAPGCSKKEPVEGSLFPPEKEITIAGRALGFTTGVTARTFVRYGVDPDRLDHVAYPAAAGRRDRAYREDHQIQLLDVAADRLIYYQLGAETKLNGVQFAPVYSFTAQVGPPSGVLTATMVHIGFGDAHILTMPNTGKRILIDAGWDDAAPTVREYMSTHGIETLDGMLATHVHYDHIGGIIGSNQNGILATHPPAYFYDSPRKDAGGDRYAYAQLNDMLSKREMDSTVLRRFDTSSTVEALQWDPAVDVLVLNSGTPADYNSVDYDGTDINNESIVLRISYGDVDFVIGGDAEQESETSMIAAFAGWDLQTEYYKASHHGLGDASSGAWVNLLQPRVAFIPNTAYSWDGDLDSALSETMGTLSAVGAHVYAIDDVPLIGETRPDGIQHNITFATDGVSYEIRVEVAEQLAPRKMASKASCVHGDPDLKHLFPQEGAAAGGDPQE